MLDSLRKYADWRVIEFFLRNPTRKVYVKELSAELGVSSFTASRTLSRLRAGSFLECEELARAKFYSLVDNPMTRALKRFRVLADLQAAKFVESLLKADSDLAVAVIYGSCATGDYDERSDVDIIIVSDKPDSVFANAARTAAKTMGMEVNPQVYTLAGWRDIADKDRTFYESVIRNSVVIHGSGLVVK